MWESRLVEGLLERFLTTPVSAFVNRLREYRGEASGVEWVEKVTLLIANESGQRRLTNRLSSVLADIDTDDPESLVDGIVEIWAIIQEVKNRLTVPRDTSVFDGRPVSPVALDSDLFTPTIIDSSEDSQDESSFFHSCSPKSPVECLDIPASPDPEEEYEDE